MHDEIESLREMAGPGALGNLTLAVEDARSELTWISLERLGQDLRYAVRILVKSYSFTGLCVLTLALGIGATSTIFSWINGTLLNPIPGAQRTREIVSLTRGDLSDSPTPPYSYPDLLDLKLLKTVLLPAPQARLSREAGREADEAAVGLLAIGRQEQSVAVRIAGDEADVQPERIAQQHRTH